jgi:hypothetical protein
MSKNIVVVIVVVVVMILAFFSSCCPKNYSMFFENKFCCFTRSVRSAEQTLVCASFSFFHFSSSSLKMFLTEKNYLFHFLNNFLTSDEICKFFKKKVRFNFQAHKIEKSYAFFLKRFTMLNLFCKTCYKNISATDFPRMLFTIMF